MSPVKTRKQKSVQRQATSDDGSPKSTKSASDNSSTDSKKGDRSKPSSPKSAKQSQKPVAQSQRATTPKKHSPSEQSHSSGGSRRSKARRDKSKAHATSPSSTKKSHHDDTPAAKAPSGRTAQQDHATRIHTQAGTSLGRGTPSREGGVRTHEGLTGSATNPSRASEHVSPEVVDLTMNSSIVSQATDNTGYVHFDDTKQPVNRTWSNTMAGESTPSTGRQLFGNLLARATGKSTSPRRR